MALHGSCHFDDCRVLPPPPPLPDWGWDWEWELRCAIGDGAAAARDGSIHDAFTAVPSCVESPPESSSSSEAWSGGGGGGYLEDAVADWSDRCKRQRTAEEPAPPRCPAMASEDLQCLLQSFWDPSSGEGDLLHDLNPTMVPGAVMGSFASEQGDASGREKEQKQVEGGPSAAAAAGQGEGEGDEDEEAAAGPPPPPFSATGAGASPLQKATTGRGSHYCEPASSSSSSLAGRSGGEGGGAGVLYPFAVVKPLGLDGATLSDVNRRILKRPARPVRHPVGQFACSPVVSSPNGPGLSGKAIVSLTKIRTGGKGTITIIRTRG